MDIDIINNILCCPKCKTTLNIKSLENCSLKCSNCGRVFKIEDGIFDFGSREQEIVNNWSSSTTEEEQMKQIQEWLSQGLLKEDDLQQISCEINVEKMDFAIEQGIQAIHKKMLQPDNKILLDLATGMGRIFNDIGVLKNLSGKIIILSDLSKFVLNKVRKRLEEMIVVDNFIFIACDCRNLPIYKESIDLISSLSAFDNATEPKEILDEVYRVLNTNKELIEISMFSDESSRSLKMAEAFGSGALATTNRMRKSLKTINFADVKIESLFKGIAHGKGDLLPLKNDSIEISLVSACKRM